MRVWVISRRGVPSPFTAVTFLEGGRARGILVSPSGVRGLQEEEALRYLELSKRGERAFPDFVPALDRAEGLEVEDKAGEELRSLLEELEGARETEARIYGESGGRSVLAYGALVEATFDPAWLLDGCSYYLPSISSAGYTQLTKQDILDRKLYLNEPGSRPWAEGHQYSYWTNKTKSAVENIVGKDLGLRLSRLEQGLGSLQDVRKLLVEREENLRKEVQKVGGKSLSGDYYWDVRSQLFFFDPSGSTVLPWKGSADYSGVNRY